MKFSKTYLFIFVFFFAAVGVKLVLFGHATTTSSICNFFASPNGSDANVGSISAPFQSVAKLDQALSAGQTGCLRAGIYGSTSTLIALNSNGTSTAQLTIRNYPGEIAQIDGFIEMGGSNNNGQYTTLSHLIINGTNTFHDDTTGPCPSQITASEAFQINGLGDVFEYNEFYQTDPLKGNGIGVGFETNGGWSPPDNAIIRYNKIHDVGQCMAFDHLIYLSHGDNVQIYGNWMWSDQHGWGVQIYPDPSNASIHSNVIDSAGSGFVVGNEAGDSVDNNQIFNNVVMNSTGLPDAGLSEGVGISDSWGGTPGTGNSFTNNDSFNNAGGISHVSHVNVSGNITSNPLFADPANHDYTLKAGSPVASYGLWDGADLGFGLIGDLNGDKHVNAFDLSIFLNHWLQSGTGITEDFNNDGYVNAFDLNIMLGQWGK